MQRPPLEVADIVRAAGRKFIANSREWITRRHLKVLRAIVSCRTAALGYHVDECTRCGYSGHSYNSCRDRHCPKCQANARLRWIARRKKELLPVPYAHIVFTVPRRLAQLALQNKQLIYAMLLRLSAETLIEVARNPKRLGAEIGFFSVLHSWTQTMEHHPHVHCVVPAGGLSFDHLRWVPSSPRFFLPKGVLRKVFRGKVRAALNDAFDQGKIGFHGELRQFSQPSAFRAFVRELYRQDWVVHCKRPFGGPEYVLRYLGRYTHRVAISNHRLVSFANGEVTFRWRDRAHGSVERMMTLPVEKFLRRFLFHVLPKRFVRIRSFGYLANRRRGILLPICFQCLQSAPETPTTEAQNQDTAGLWTCPQCGGPMVAILRVNLPRRQPRPPPVAFAWG
ncbi:MAG: transposase [Candidatus Methylomirabilota bacterium]|nr:MAG: transposase [candidate division NC10 bacterium]